MIDYSQGYWGVTLICALKGSVFPKAICWALPCGVAAAAMNYLYFDVLSLEPWANTEITTLWSSYTFILGFLVVFRTQKAYDRYWEGAMLLRRARGEWFNAYSSLIAFCTSNEEKRFEVEGWQHLLARLFSMLNCGALQTIADTEDDLFEYFDYAGMDKKRLCFLASKQDPHLRMEILIQWIQKHVVMGQESGLVTIPPPILSRAFQEISRGAVNFNEMRNFTEIPFPFPWAQMLALLLIFFCIGTPVLSGLVLASGGTGAVLTFVSVLAFWGTNYIAAEIESPFGDDANDLPIKRMQQDMNVSLWCLLEIYAQSPPAFSFDKGSHREPIIRNNSFSEVDGKPVQPASALETLGSRQTAFERACEATSTNSMGRRWSLGHIGLPKVITPTSRRRHKKFASSPPTVMSRITTRVFGSGADIYSAQPPLSMNRVVSPENEEEELRCPHVEDPVDPLVEARCQAIGKKHSTSVGSTNGITVDAVYSTKSNGEILAPEGHELHFAFEKKAEPATGQPIIAVSRARPDDSV